MREELQTGEIQGTQTRAALSMQGLQTLAAPHIQGFKPAPAEVKKLHTGAGGEVQFGHVAVIQVHPCEVWNAGDVEGGVKPVVVACQCHQLGTHAQAQRCDLVVIAREGVQGRTVEERSKLTEVIVAAVELPQSLESSEPQFADAQLRASELLQ